MNNNSLLPNLRCKDNECSIDSSGKCIWCGHFPGLEISQDQEYQLEFKLLEVEIQNKIESGTIVTMTDGYPAEGLFLDYHNNSHMKILWYKAQNRSFQWSSRFIKAKEPQEITKDISQDLRTFIGKLQYKIKMGMVQSPNEI